MKRHRLTPEQQRTRLPPTQVGWRLRLYVLLVQAFLFASLKVPKSLLGQLTKHETLLRSCFWFRVVGHEQRRIEPDCVAKYLSQDEDAIRVRLCAINCLLNDPHAEIERLCALAAVYGIALSSEVNRRPSACVNAPYADNITHACARAKMTPKARPPPIATRFQNPSPAGEAPVSAAVGAGKTWSELQPANPMHRTKRLPPLAETLKRHARIRCLVKAG